MVTIDYTGLRLTGALCINRLTALELHVGVNEHGWAVVEGEAGEDALEQLQGAVADREQVIMVQDETGEEQPLFAGVIRSAGLITYGGYNRFRIELQSGTIQMDQVKRSRSFQDVAQTYSQVAQRVAGGRTKSWTSHTAHPRRCLYSIGLSPPNDSLMRLQLYQLI